MHEVRKKTRQARGRCTGSAQTEFLDIIEKNLIFVVTLTES